MSGHFNSVALLLLIFTTSPLAAHIRGVLQSLINREAAREYGPLVLSTIPKVEDIESMVAEQTVGAPYGSEIPPFRVPKEFHKELMGYFDKSAIDVSPILLLEEVACVVTTSKTGSKCRICVYGGAQGAPTMFSVSGIRCVKTDWDKKGEAAGHFLTLLKKISPPPPPPPKLPPGTPTF